MALSLESQESILASDDEEEEDVAVNSKMPSMRIMKLKLVELKLESDGAEEYDESAESSASVDVVEPMELEDLDMSNELTDSEITAKTADEYVDNLIVALNEKDEVKNKLVHISLQNTMKKLQGHFAIRIVCHRKTSKSEMIKLIDSFVDSETDEETDPIKHDDFIIFLMRELRAKEPHPLQKYAEIFVLTSGNAYNLIAKADRDEEFPKKIARRVLEFNLRSLSSKQLTGPTTSTAQTYREGEGKCLTFWDYLGQITASYKMPLRSDSCLYRLPCFTTKAGKVKNVSVTVGPDYLRVHHKMSLKDNAALLLQLSRICRGHETLKYLKSTPEVDNTCFEVFGQITIMKGKHFVEKQNKILKEWLKSCLEKKQKVRMLLSHRKLESWHEANEFSLQAKVNGQRRRVTLEEWHGSPPSIEAIFDVIRKKLPVYQLDSLFLTFQDSTKEKPEKNSDPLLMFLEGHFDTQSGMSLFRYCGDWLKIENEYMTHLEKEFIDIVLNCYVDSNYILPLPWPFSGSDVPKSIKVKDKTQKTRPSLPTTRDTFKKWYHWIYPGNLKWDSADIPSRDVIFDEYPGKDWKRWKTALQIFLRLHCHQTEAHYNEGYIWHDRILENDGSGYLLGDRILMKNVELYDILFYTPKTTYLIHVKEGFGNTTRDACSQIRISADLVFRNVICNNKFDILEELWKTITKYEGQSEKREYKYRSTVKDCYLGLGTKDTFVDLFRTKNIVYVLAVRDSGRFQKRVTAPFVLYPVEKIEKTFRIDSHSVTDELLRCKYLKKSGEKVIITDKVIGKTMKEAEQEIKLKSVSKSREAFRILQHTMSGHKSFIAKMEVVHLFSYFKRLQTPSSRLSLKICFIDKTLPED